MFSLFKRPPKPRPLVRLVLDDGEDAERCDDCTTDAARGWVSVHDMNPLFARACGDECTCRLQFNEKSTPEEKRQYLEAARKEDPEMFAFAEMLGHPISEDDLDD